MALLLAAFLAFPVGAQEPPPYSVVSIYRVAPGKHVDFLKWMAAREAVDKEAGVAPTQWYAHQTGDSWDFVGVSPNIDDATADRVDEMARKRGLKVGPTASIEFRSIIASHTDTIAVGPVSADFLLKGATGK
ncbi:hypothetical protein GCM10023332_15260 [Luteimonas vadosa]|uniref:Uncharacterized protein n=1 Tax=Luteimonas vadosa TaxID=1165507 RepID=A0ABP9DYL7_9GAMM